MNNISHIRRLKKKANILKETRIKSCTARFEVGVWVGMYTRLQFLRAVNYSLVAHADALRPDIMISTSSDSDDEPLTATVDMATNVSYRRRRSARRHPTLRSVPYCCSAFWRHPL